jgi:FkbM family methyltransferase
MKAPTMPVPVAAKAPSSDGRRAPFSLKILRSLTRLIPPLPHASGVGNRFVKPLWCALHADSYVLPVWDGVRMVVNPGDTVGGNLTFVPHLYERWERSAVRRLLSHGDTFVDLGANIGAYALWAATLVGPRGTVLAVEPEPRNYALLRRNIELNGLLNVQALHLGVSDRRETLTLFLSESNSGGHTFVHQAESRGRRVDVPCKPVVEVLRDAEVTRVDLMKVDIEGFEERVLSKFLEDVPPDSPLRPKHILTELFFGRSGPAGDRLIRRICEAGYVLVTRKKADALLRRADLPSDPGSR